MKKIRVLLEKVKVKVKDFIERPLLYKYPLFISYPRSGAHWINSLMELYFDRPRLRKGRPTFLDKRRKDWMWIHDHDLDLRLIKGFESLNLHKKILFLYRNPVEVIFSHLNAKNKNFDRYGYLFGDKNSKENYLDNRKLIEKELEDWIAYHKAYLLGKNKLVITKINYDNFLDVKKREKEFSKICNHFNKEFDKEKFNKIFEKYGKINLDKNRGLEKTKYIEMKKKFLSKWGRLIEERIKESGILVA